MSRSRTNLLADSLIPPSTHPPQAQQQRRRRKGAKEWRVLQAARRLDWLCLRIRCGRWLQWAKLARTRHCEPQQASPCLRPSQPLRTTTLPQWSCGCCCCYLSQGGRCIPGYQSHSPLHNLPVGSLLHIIFYWPSLQWVNKYVFELWNIATNFARAPIFSHEKRMGNIDKGSYTPFKFFPKGCSFCSSS